MNKRLLLLLMLGVLFVVSCTNNANQFLYDASDTLSDSYIEDTEEEEEEEDQDSVSGILVLLSVDPSSITEDDDSAIVTVTLSEATSEICTVNLSLSGDATLDSDYSIGSTVLVIPAGSTSITTTVSLIHDTENEGEESIIIDINSVDCNDTTVVESGTQQETITIIDNDGPYVSLSTNLDSISENGGVATITASLLDESGEEYTAGDDITVTLSTSGDATSGSDYSLSNTTITISAGSTDETFTLNAIDDSEYEGNETATVLIASATGDNIDIGDDNSVDVTILEDDDAIYIYLESDASSINENGGSTAITAYAVYEDNTAYSGTDSFTVTLTASGASSSDYSLDTSITINSGSSNESNTLFGIDDTIYEGTETLTIAIASVAGSNVYIGSPSSVFVSIADDESEPVISLSVSSSSVSEGNTLTVTATTATQADSDITVGLSETLDTASSSDYSLANSITISAGSSTGTATFTAINDSTDESSSEVLYVSIDSVSLGSFNASNHSITIIDTDSEPSVSLSIGDTTLNEGESTTITATLSGSISDTATVISLSTSGASSSDYSLSSSTITIPAGSSSASTTFFATADDTYDGASNVIETVAISGTVTSGNTSNSSISNQTIEITDMDSDPGNF